MELSVKGGLGIFEGSNFAIKLPEHNRILFLVMNELVLLARDCCVTR